MITDSPGATSTMEAAARAASVPRRRQIRNRPLQCRGVVHAITRHADDVAVFLKHIDDVEFMFRENLGETVGILDRPGHAAVSSVWNHPAWLRRECSNPSPVFWRSPARSPSASPVTILILTPIRAAIATVDFGVFARRIEQRQHAEKLPLSVAVRSRDTKRAKPARSEIIDGLVHGGLDGGGIRRQRQDNLRRALGNLERLPSAAFTVASVRLCTGSNGMKWVTCIGLQRLLVLQASQHRQIDGVVISGPGRQSTGEDGRG